MKRLLGFIALFYTLPANSQSYIPFPVDSAIWTVDFITQTLPFGNELHTPRGYTIAGDSLLNGFLYSKICTSDSAGITNPSGLVALTREQNKIVYCKYVGASGPQLPNEVILYNFNLTTGDSFSYESFFGNPTVLVVDSVGPFQTLTGPRNALYLSIVSNLSFAAYFNPIWVEGIGDVVNGVIYLEVPWVDWWCEGLCFFHQSVHVWNRYNNYCWLPTGINEIASEENKITCYPNPSPNDMVITFNNQHGIKTLDVFNTAGEKIFEKTTTSNECILKKQTFSSGIFLLRVITDENVIQFNKIVFTN